jgi:stromal membrane-associated protein
MSDFESDAKQMILELMGKEGNSLCADCNSNDPTWVSVNNKVFICTQCAGVHRSLGVEYSFVQSVKLDDWKIDIVNEILTGGSTNTVNEEYLEFSVPENVLKPNPNSSRQDRESYISKKYVDRMFLPGDGKEKRRPNSIPQSEVNGESSCTSIGAIEFVGVVKIKLVSCTNLVNADVVGYSDPYVTMNLGKQTLKSKTINNNLNPVFNEMIIFSWDGKAPLYIQVIDKDVTNDDGKLMSQYY